MNVKKSSVFGREQQRWQWHRCIHMLINVFLHQLKELGLEHFKGTHRISVCHNVHQHIYQIEHVDIIYHEYA
jgi:hypothetical protein